MDRHCVTINMWKLRDRLQAEQGHFLSLSEVSAWLLGRGFENRGGWCCDDGALASLRPDEVTGHVTFQYDHGTWFVKSDPPLPG